MRRQRSHCKSNDKALHLSDDAAAKGLLAAVQYGKSGMHSRFYWCRTDCTSAVNELR